MWGALENPRSLSARRALPPAIRHAAHHSPHPGAIRLSGAFSPLTGVSADQARSVTLFKYENTATTRDHDFNAGGVKHTNTVTQEGHRSKTFTTGDTDQSLVISSNSKTEGNNKSEFNTNQYIPDNLPYTSTTSSNEYRTWSNYSASHQVDEDGSVSGGKLNASNGSSASTKFEREGTSEDIGGTIFTLTTDESESGAESRTTEEGNYGDGQTYTGMATYTFSSWEKNQSEWSIDDSNSSGLSWTDSERHRSRSTTNTAWNFGANGSSSTTEYSSSIHNNGKLSELDEIGDEDARRTETTAKGSFNGSGGSGTYERSRSVYNVVGGNLPTRDTHVDDSSYLSTQSSGIGKRTGESGPVTTGTIEASIDLGGGLVGDAPTGSFSELLDILNGSISDAESAAFFDGPPPAIGPLGPPPAEMDHLAGIVPKHELEIGKIKYGDGPGTLSYAIEFASLVTGFKAAQTVGQVAKIVGKELLEGAADVATDGLSSFAGFFKGRFSKPNKVGIVDDVEAPTGGTYKLRDADGNVKRTGLTNDLKRRQAEHGRYSDTKDLDFEVDKFSDDAIARRGREQRIYDQHPEAQAANGGLNKRRPISERNPRLQEYLDAGDEL